MVRQIRFAQQRCMGLAPLMEATVSVYSAFCTCHASMTITTRVHTHIHTRTHTVHTHTHTHTPTHTQTHTLRPHICMHTHTLTCTHKHTGMNKKKLEDNLFAHCISLVLLFNIVSFYLIMLLRGTCRSWEFIWHILVCRLSCFHYVAFYRHFSEVYY